MPLLAGIWVSPTGRFLQPDTKRTRIKLRAMSAVLWTDFIVLVLGRWAVWFQRDHEGWEQLPCTGLISFVRLLGTSSKDTTRLPFTRLVYTTVRELGAQEGSSPSATVVT